MTEKRLAKALLSLGVPEMSSAEVRGMTERILARDRRWVKVLIVITSLLWLASASTLYWFAFSLIGTYAEMQHAGGPEADPMIKTIYEFLIVLASSVEGLIYALLCTFLLMFFSRRATLRQINANLIEISRQLKELGSDE